ncbi:hypothetical protein [Stenoxybacter acetivorans]|uniref:hypothetical protein n=1 Tax=Stenoxybacter acetivorans TaxID=422441 RepID=UPI0005661CA9|nr:hypothetical protein [Stenoxybacter acetivorans]
MFNWLVEGAVEIVKAPFKITGAVVTETVKAVETTDEFLEEVVFGNESVSDFNKRKRNEEEK